MAGSKSYSKRSFASPNVGLQLQLTTPYYQEYPKLQTNEPDEDTWLEPRPMQVTSAPPRTDLHTAGYSYYQPQSGGAAGVQNPSGYPASTASYSAYPQLQSGEAALHQEPSNYQLTMATPPPQLELAPATASTTIRSTQALITDIPTSDQDVVRALKTNSDNISKLIHQLEEKKTQLSIRPSQITTACDDLMHGLTIVRATYCYQQPGWKYISARGIYNEKVKKIEDMGKELMQAKHTFTDERSRTNDQPTASKNLVSALNLAKKVVDENRRCDEVFDLLAKVGATKNKERHQDRMNNEEVYTSRCSNAAIILNAIGNLVPELSMF